MADYLLFAVLGLGSGAVYALMGCGLVVARRGSEVINFAHGAMAMACTYVFVDVVQDGVLRLPIPGLPTPQIADEGTSVLSAFLIALAFAMLLGLILHFLVFSPLRTAPPLSRVVASVGVMIVLQASAQLRYGDIRRQPGRFLPGGELEIAGRVIPLDRIWLVVIAILITIALGAAYRFTAFGRSTAAVATSERAAALLGISASKVAAANWMIASMLAAGAGILISPLGGVDVENYTLLVVPALGAALVGKFNSFGVTCAAGLVFGMLQGLISKLQTVAYVPDWARSGVKEGLPFLVILLVVAVLRPRIPERGAVTTSRLPSAPSDGGSIPGTILVGALAVAAVMLTSGSARLAVVLAVVFGILALSLVVLTGYVGQISLAQAAFAGTAGFTAARLATDAGVPLLLAHVLAVGAAVLLGLVIGLPSLRTHGVTLAVVTLAAGVAVEQFIFKNPYFTGGKVGTNVPDLDYFGWNLAAGTGREFPSARFGLFTVASLCLMYASVGYLRRSKLGTRMLAVRANEKGAAASGVNVAQTKLIGFCLSAAVAGWAGVLTGHLRGQLSFESFGVVISLNILAISYLGGISRPSGAVAGSLLANGAVVAFLLDRHVELGEWAYFVSGMGMIVAAILNPDGIAGEVARVRSVLAKRLRFGPHGEGRDSSAGSVSAIPAESAEV